MNTKNLKGNFIKKEFPSKGVIYITKSAREQIKFLHNKIQTEWSGVLVFTILDGNLLEPAKIKIKVLGLYLMDIGNHSFTTFENVDYENLLDIEEFNVPNIQLGLIHSHHSMGVFYSGTDSKELEDNCPKHKPFYLSLVVNNKGEYYAKIAWNEKEIISSMEIKRKVYVNNEEQELSSIVNQVEKNILITMDMTIHDLFDLDDLVKIDNQVLLTISNTLPTKETNNQVFIQRYEEILSKKEKEKEKFVTRFGNGGLFDEVEDTRHFSKFLGTFKNSKVDYLEEEISGTTFILKLRDIHYFITLVMTGCTLRDGNLDGFLSIRLPMFIKSNNSSPDEASIKRAAGIINLRTIFCIGLCIKSLLEPHKINVV